MTKGPLPVTCEDRLIKLITSTIAPSSWGERGGRGTIDYFPLSMSIIVNQTPAIQEQVAELLAAQRRMMDKEVMVEVKFAEIAVDVFEDLQKRNILGNPDKETHGQGNVLFLNDAQMLRFMEAIQDDVRTNVMQAPRLTMLNGQNAAFNTLDVQHFVTGLEIVHCDDHIEYRPKSETIPLGLQMGLHSVISADRRSVRVHLDAKLSNLASNEIARLPITTPAQGNEKGPDSKPRMVTHYIDQPQVNRMGVNRTLVIPDGKTAVLIGLIRQCEVTKNIGAPILSEIPYLGQLFRKVECEPHHILVMMTPRIVTNQEQEEKKPRTLPHSK